MVEFTCVLGTNSFCCLSRAFKSIRHKKSLPSTQDSHAYQQEHVEDKKEGATMNGTTPHSFRSNIEDNVRGNDPTRSSSSSSSSSRRCCIDRNRTRSLDSSSCFPCLSRNDIVEKHIRRKKSRGSYEFIPTPSSIGSRVPSNVQSCNPSRSRSSTQIMFSKSSGLLKPSPIEKTIECTLEELCYGCEKKIKITRDVFADTGELIQEEEKLTINVQPGWKTGTKITFEGKGNDKPGKYRGDIVFFISEKKHPLFRREGDDLELGVEIPLIKALTGCRISVPMLGGEKMNLTVEDIIYPGYEKVIDGQGMPISKEPGKRGNLRITFLVEFPTELTDSQRSEIVNILQDSS